MALNSVIRLLDGQLAASATHTEGVNTVQVPNFSRQAVDYAHVVFETLKVDGTGSSDMNVNGSSTPVDFQYIVPAEQELHLSRILMHLADSSLNDFDKFTADGPLVTGLDISILDDSDVEVLDFTGGIPVDRLGSFYLFAGVDVTHHNGTPNDAVGIRWSLDRAVGAPVSLPAGFKINITVNDDLTGLISYEVLVQGEIREV